MLWSSPKNSIWAVTWGLSAWRCFSCILKLIQRRARMRMQEMMLWWRRFLVFICFSLSVSLSVMLDPPPAHIVLSKLREDPRSNPGSNTERRHNWFKLITSLYLIWSPPTSQFDNNEINRRVGNPEKLFIMLTGNIHSTLCYLNIIINTTNMI